MHDDHFLIIETASSWADGEDYNRWLPWNQTDVEVPYAKGHSFTYPGFIYVIIKGLQSISIKDPKIQMIFIRLIQSLFWIIAIRISFKITEKIGTQTAAKKVGWLLTIGAFIPFLAVRNLVEMTCIPFLMLGIWHTLKSEKWHSFLLAGIYFGIACSVRYQVVLFVGVYGLIMPFKFGLKNCIYTLIGLVGTLLLTQGLVDYLIWGRPFEEFNAYRAYNDSDHKYDYAKDMGGIGYITYFIILTNISIPVIGLFYWWGMIKNWKKYLLLLLPFLVFVAFHSYYPNRQERFIFPMIPIFLIIGISGWELVRSKSDFWMNRPKLWRKLTTPFIVITFVIGIASAFVSTKKSRIDSAYFLYGKENTSLIVKEHPNADTPMSPMHYAKKWNTPSPNYSTKTLAEKIKKVPNFKPRYIFSYSETKFNKRFSEIKVLYPDAKIVETCNPSWFDKLLFWLNPRGNKNEVIRIIET